MILINLRLFGRRITKMGKLQRNRCPRCGGAMFIDDDVDGWYEQCINCSYRHELKETEELTGVTASKGGTYRK
jgi:ribosomal protein S27AE